MNLILASSSPRRREILALLGLPFEVVAPGFDEHTSSGRPIADEVRLFAAGKAASVARDYPGSLAIGSDTMISIDNRKIGKPADLADAKQILRALSGKRHLIYTGVAILDGTGGPGLEVIEEVSVKMHPYTEREIESYVACNESLDKAGAYSIQGHGAALIEAIEGDYLAAVGMPLKPIAKYLASRGVELPVDVERIYADKAFRNWQNF